MKMLVHWSIIRIIHRCWRNFALLLDRLSLDIYNNHGFISNSLDTHTIFSVLENDRLE